MHASQNNFQLALEEMQNISNPTEKQMQFIAILYYKLEKWDELVRQSKDLLKLNKGNLKGVMLLMKAYEELKDTKHLIKLTDKIKQKVSGFALNSVS